MLGCKKLNEIKDELTDPCSVLDPIRVSAFGLIFYNILPVSRLAEKEDQVFGLRLASHVSWRLES